MDGSEADVDVEIDDESTQQGEAQLSGGERQSQGAAGSSAGSGRGKRTLIGFAQRSILEEFYRSGMNSASMQFQHMHQAACDKTGLDLNVVKVQHGMNPYIHVFPLFLDQFRSHICFACAS